MTVLQFQWRQFLCVLPDTKITHENARKFRCKLHRLCRWEGELRGLGGRPLQDCQKRLGFCTCGHFACWLDVRVTDHLGSRTLGKPLSPGHTGAADASGSTAELRRGTVPKPPHLQSAV